MKIVQTSTIVCLAFFLSTAISFAADLDDIDFTIRVVESDDVGEMHNELSLPDMTFDVTHEYAESGTGGEHEHEVEIRDEREDEIEDHDEAREDGDDINDEYDETHEDEHEEEHENETHEEEHAREID